MRPFGRYCQGKRTLATLASLPRPRGRGKASVASAFARRSRRDMLDLSLSGHDPERSLVLQCVNWPVAKCLHTRLADPGQFGILGTRSWLAGARCNLVY